jgi:hypothetical protein
MALKSESLVHLGARFNDYLFLFVKVKDTHSHNEPWLIKTVPKLGGKVFVHNSNLFTRLQ